MADDLRHRIGRLFYAQDQPIEHMRPIPWEDTWRRVPAKYTHCMKMADAAISACDPIDIATGLTWKERFLERAERTKKLEAALRSFMCFTHGLCCIGCSAQGRELANFCCKDADCDAGFYGVDADAIRDLLNGGEELMPGTLAQIENDQPVVNEAAPDKRQAKERRIVDAGGLWARPRQGVSIRMIQDRRIADRRKAQPETSEVE